MGSLVEVAQVMDFPPSSPKTKKWGIKEFGNKLCIIFGELLHEAGYVQEGIRKDEVISVGVQIDEWNSMYIEEPMAPKK